MGNRVPDLLSAFKEKSVIMEQQQQQNSSLKQTQRLIMSSQMQQALRLLQLSAMELEAVISAQLEQNPVIEIISEFENDEDEDLDCPIEEEDSLGFDFSEEKRSGSRTLEDEEHRTFMEQSICSPLSLFEHLMQQAHETFSTPEKREMAEALIGNFDENGYLHIPLEEISLLHNFSEEDLQKVLNQIQLFDPCGVGATTLQESLLIQLVRQNKQDTLAKQIIEHYYDDLLRNHILTIQKGLQCSPEEIIDAIEKHIARLDLHPGAAYSQQVEQRLVPDVTLRHDGERWQVDVNDDFLPPIRIQSRYRQMMVDPDSTEDTKAFIRKKIGSVKWLLRNIIQRNETLSKIAESLVKRQNAFLFDFSGELVPMTMKGLAEELGLHESTIARAVSNKYLECPRGLLPLRFFFTHAYVSETGKEISSKTVRTIIKEVIDNEDKSQPLSDEALSVCLKERGILCARRTVAKYRTELNLGNAQQRKKFNQ